jgi:hypothetical protein
MKLGDPRWRTLKGGYRKLYDPTPVLARIESGAALGEAWNELWTSSTTKAM